MDRAEVAVLGAGNMGTALAQVVGTNGHHVRLWSIEHDVLEDVRDNHHNTRYLDGVRLNENIEAVWDIAHAVSHARLVIVSVPSQVVRRLAQDIGQLVQPGQLVLNVAKGLEADTYKRMSEILSQELADGCAPYIGSMGGPAIAIEMAKGQPLAVIIAVPDAKSLAACQALLQNNHLKVATTQDVTGLELCATLKNIYAIALGMADGIGHGTNMKAFLASVALDEMAAITKTLGGQQATVYGLAGIGDLLTTGFSEHSRNRTLGEKLGGDTDWQLFLRTNTVEGVTACRAISELVKNEAQHFPLLATIHAVLFEEEPAPAALRRFQEDFSYGS
ncbi:MAG TPA: NAD(P)H-dependent glycerol-3-phosphate dehydrogenase [Dehalococcoidia bacterium]|jgi:glycerol-3-phosphate dehydrogenase (NAD(P)+)|nr:NAD(P)H-dependent glycerol-3-phosphate dehydrogenase [Dehalococcoidia bacterium]